jgi:hypothetical protein
MLAFEYKEASAERKQELLQEIISLYNMADKAQVVQALAHVQSVYEVTQEDFSEIAGVSARTLRDWKNKDYPELYEEAFKKYTPIPEVLDVNVKHDEDVLEQVYSNMLSKISDKKTSAKDLSLLLQYLNISSAELKQYAKHRGSTLRNYVKDNEALLIKDEETLSLTKAFLAESDYLYFGTEKTLGHTENFLEMDLDNNLVRLELMTAGMLMYSLWNGTIHPNYVEMAQTLRVLKIASGEALDTKQSITEFDSIDAKPKKLKPVTEKFRKELVDLFGQAEGEELYQKMLNAKADVDKKTAIVLPAYEAVEQDYTKHLRVFPKLEDMPLEVLLSKLDGDADKSYRDKYKNYLNNQEEN